MSDFLETCKVRLVDAQKRFQTAQGNLQRAQQEFAVSQLELNNWQGVVNSELRLQQLAQVNQIPLPMVQPKTQAPVESDAAKLRALLPARPVTEHAQPQSSDVNKTEMVRELLAQHPDGMTPVEVWSVLKNHIARPYVYSILKRLKDADEVIYQRRRKKYSLRVNQKPEEDSKEQANSVQ